MKQIVLRELAIILVMVFCGLVLLPIGIYYVGQAVFGSYGGHGYGDFFSTLSAKIRNGDPVAWFLVLSPYLTVQTLRLMRLGWRRSAAGRAGEHRDARRTV